MDGIGLLGGSFDPFHLGHRYLCERFQESLGLKKLFLIPSFQPPHKFNRQVASFEDRFHMCQLATEDLPYIEVDPIEATLPQGGYFISVVETFRQRYPNNTLFLLTGSDTYQYLTSWFQAREMLSLIIPCTLYRPGSDSERFLKTKALLDQWGITTMVIESDAPDISSTAIRKNLAEHQDVSHWLHPKVHAYVLEHTLYTARSN